MFKFKRLLAVLLMLFSLGLPVAAQDVDLTPEPSPIVTEGDTPVTVEDGEPPVVVVPDRTEPILLAALVVASIVIALLLGTVLVLAKAGYNALPEWAQGLIVNNRGWIEARTEEGLVRLDEAVLLTPNKLDDLLAGYVREGVKKGLQDFFSSEAGSQVASRYTSSGGSWLPPEGSQPHR